MYEDDNRFEWDVDDGRPTHKCSVCREVWIDNALDEVCPECWEQMETPTEELVGSLEALQEEAWHFETLAQEAECENLRKYYLRRARNAQAEIELLVEELKDRRGEGKSPDAEEEEEVMPPF